MKKETTFAVLMIVFGIITGLFITEVLSAVAIPQFKGYLLPLKQKADYEYMSNSLFFSGKYWVSHFVVVAIAAIASFIMLLLNANPNIASALKDEQRRLKAITVFLSCLPCVFLLVLSIYATRDYIAPDMPVSADLLMFSLSLIVCGSLWLIMGETGLAGDFSSWKMGKDARPVKSFALGALVGATIYGTVYLWGWLFRKYLILVAEVLGKSGETSYLGYTLLNRELVFTSALSFGIMAGVMLALAPVRLDPKQRLARMIFPGVLLFILLTATYGVYSDAVAKYDFGKKDLAEAAGLSEKAVESRTVVLLGPDNATIREWRMQAGAFRNVMPSNTIQLTTENLKRLEDYIEGHKNGSVYKYTGLLALSDGYLRLWDMEKGLDRKFKNSESFIIDGLVLVNKLRYLPVTPVNVSYLKEYADESKWSADGKYGLSIAKAFIHFGLKEDAQRRLKKAKDAGDNVSGIEFVSDEVLTNGKIFGKLSVNSKAPQNAKVALMHYEKPKSGKYAFSLVNMADARETDRAGNFAFDHLGNGEYVLAIMTDNETIPYKTPAKKLLMKNMPGVITLGAKTATRNLGNIDVAIGN